MIFLLESPSGFGLLRVQLGEQTLSELIGRSEELIGRVTPIRHTRFADADRAIHGFGAHENGNLCNELINLLAPPLEETRVGVGSEYLRWLLHFSGRRNFTHDGVLGEFQRIIIRNLHAVFPELAFDEFVVDAAGQLDALIIPLLNYVRIIRAAYDPHYDPELSELVTDDSTYIRVVRLLQDRANASTADLSGILGHKSVVAVAGAAARSRGRAILREEEWSTLSWLCDEYFLELDRKDITTSYLKRAVKLVAPNLCSVVREDVAGWMISTAGGLRALGERPATSHKLDPMSFCFLVHSIVQEEGSDQLYEKAKQVASRAVSAILHDIYGVEGGAVVTAPSPNPTVPSQSLVPVEESPIPESTSSGAGRRRKNITTQTRTPRPVRACRNW